MTLTTLLIIVLVLVLISGNYVHRDGTPYFGGGPHFGGLLGVVLLVLVVLALLGHL